MIGTNEIRMMAMHSLAFQTDPEAPRAIIAMSAHSRNHSSARSTIFAIAAGILFLLGGGTALVAQHCRANARG
jgi:hypothetical protein